jgi:hypothetical protein
MFDEKNAPTPTFTYSDKDSFYACVMYASSAMMCFRADANEMKIEVFQQLNPIDYFELSNPVYNITLH